MAQTSGKLPLPQTTSDQDKKNDIAFLQAYGKSYKKMQKAQLAQMIVNQSYNVQKYKDENYQLATMGFMYYKRWKQLVKIIRKDRGLE